MYKLEALLEEILSEKIKRKKVVRRGKLIWKTFTTKPGFKIVFKGGKPIEVRVTPAEAKKMRKAAKRAARTGRHSRGAAARQMKKSLLKISKKGQKQTDTDDLIPTETLGENTMKNLKETLSKVDEARKPRTVDQLIRMLVDEGFDTDDAIEFVFDSLSNATKKKVIDDAMVEFDKWKKSISGD